MNLKIKYFLVFSFIFNFSFLPKINAEERPKDQESSPENSQVSDQDILENPEKPESKDSQDQSSGDRIQADSSDTSTEVVTPQTPGYPAKYKYGDLDIKKNTKMSMHLEENSLMLVSLEKKSNDIWQLPINRARGANTAPRGIWIYWFGKNSSTKSAFFTMDEEFTGPLAVKINDWTNSFYKNKNSKLREQYETYRERVLQESE